MKFFIILLSLAILYPADAFAMPSATRYRLNLSFLGGYQFVRNDTFMDTDTFETEKKSFDGGVGGSIKLEYNEDYNSSFGFELGYMSLDFNSKACSVMPVIFNSYYDVYYGHGTVVLRFGFGLGYLKILNSDTGLKRGYTGAFSLSLLYEVSDNLYFDLSSKYMLCTFSKDSAVKEGEDTDTNEEWVALLPVYAGLLMRF